MLERWAIALDGEVRRRLTLEQMELGTETPGPDGKSYLVFRDRFVGLRVASACGACLEPYEEDRSFAKAV